MKISLLLVFFILFGTLPIYAGRWIIKNPPLKPIILPPTYSVHHRLTFGKTTYLVVSSEFESNSLFENQNEKKLLEKLTGTVVIPDIPIKLIDPIASKPSNILDEDGWHVKSMNYEKLPKEYDGSGITVAIIDTGVEITHTALKDNIWTNEGEIADNNIDDDQNGYIDDIHGFSFVRNSPDVTDDHGHGTHCAGIIAAKPRENLIHSPQGVARGARIMPVHIIVKDDTSFLSDAAAGIKYAIDNGAKILSNSWRVYKKWNAGFIFTPEMVQPLQDAILYGENNGVIFVAAAGNEARDVDKAEDSNPIYPIGLSGFSLMVGVAATHIQEDFWFWSNFGEHSIHFAAPGMNIVSTYPTNQWYMSSGTSMATPLVAGALARGLSKGYTAEEAIERLRVSSDFKPKWEVDNLWKRTVQSKGIINIVNFLGE